MKSYHAPNPASSHRRHRTFCATGAALLIGAFAAIAAQVGHFEPLSTHKPSDSVAEILTATPDGALLIYNDRKTKQLRVVDITDPAHPAEAATLPLPVGGTPKSVAVTPNGRWLLAVVEGPDNYLAVYDVHNLSAAPVNMRLFGQPDSIAVSPDGRYAAIAIENERAADGEMPHGAAGLLTIVDLVDKPIDWKLRDVSVSGLADRFPSDPEPEFVDINAQNIAAVTLQENNHIVLVDLPTGTVINHFSAGSVTQWADLEDDKQTVFDDLLLDSRREPDAIGWTPLGNLITANEGDYDWDVDFVGGRGFTMFSPEGDVLFESGAELELTLAAFGVYDDTRSDNRGIEPEGIEIAEYGNHTFLFVGMERTKPGTVAVYRLNGRNEQPKLIQILTTGIRPEGLLAIPQRGLFVAACEDGTISIFVAQPGNQ